MIAFIDAGRDFEKYRSIPLVFEKRFFLVTAVCDVIPCAGIFDAERTGHGRRTAEVLGYVKPQDLTLSGPVKTDTKTEETAAMVGMKITKRLDEKRSVSRHKIAFSA